VSIAQPYAVDQPAGREVVGAARDGDAEDALVEADGELVWFEEKVEEKLVAVAELAVTLDVQLVLVLVLVVT
jgi:hypothetical protein